MALKYGGKIISDYSAMRGPCPNGYHIPLHTEHQDLIDMWTALGFGASSGIDFVTYFHTPTKCSRWYNGNNEGFLEVAISWSANKAPDGFYVLNAYADPEYPSENYVEADYMMGLYESFGHPIRAFKDVPVIPDSNWAIVYQGAGSAGIYHNVTLGLISISSDGTNWITLKDKNEGATTVWNYGDTLSAANVGNVYQRGNNYGFPRTGTITTSNTQVDASNYGPGNYYSSSTFITIEPYRDSPYRDSSENRNLRGGVTGVQQKPTNIIERYYGGKIIVNYEDMQGPCPTGFHISTSKDWTRAMNIGVSLGAWNNSGDHMSVYLKIPPTGLRTNQSEFYGDGEMSVYLTPEIADDEDGPGWYYPKAFQFVFNEKYSLPNEASLGGANICNGCSVRPFKNVSVIPDSNWTVLYQGTGSAGIFHNETLGLISLSSDGENRITLADRNLGATEIYNYGNELSRGNCGKLYQWGNNFGFLWQGNLVTTQTKVDGSLYGPGNYYSFNEYYIEVGDMTDWSSVRNDNRRGGVTGPERPAKVMEVYYNTTKIWPRVISYDIDDIKSGTAVLPSETVKKMVIDFSTVNPGWTVFQMNGTSNYMYITSTTSYVINIGIDGFSTLADLSSYGRSSPSETSGTVELDFASDTYNINITSIIGGVSAPYSDSGIMNSNGPFAITDRIWQDFGGVSTGTVSLVV